MWNAGMTLFVIILGVGLLTALICWIIWGRRIRLAMSERQRLLLDRDSAREKLNQTTQELNSEKQSVHSLTQELNLCVQRSEKADQAQILEASLVEQKQKTALITQENQTLGNKNTDLLSRLSDMKAQLDVLKHDNQHALSSQAQLVKEHNEQLEHLQAKSLRCEGDYKALQATYQSLLKEQEQALVDKQQLEQQIATLQQSLHQQKDSATVDADRVAQFEASIDQLKAENLALSRKLVSSSGKQARSIDEDALNLSIKRLKTDNEALNQTLQQAQLQYQQLQKEHEDKTLQHQALQTQHQSTVEALELARALNGHCDACDEKLAVIQEAQDYIDACEHKVEELEGQLNAQTTDLKRIQDNLKAVEADKQRLTLQIQQQSTTTSSKASTSSNKSEATTSTRKRKPRESQEQVLARIREKAEALDFDRIGRSNEADKDDLQRIKGIGPFIELKLNSLGIYTFKQISLFTDQDEELVNEAIEFFPGRVKRDAWVQQAKDFINV